MKLGFSTRPAQCVLLDSPGLRCRLCSHQSQVSVDLGILTSGIQWHLGPGAQSRRHDAQSESRSKVHGNTTGATGSLLGLHPRELYVSNATCNNAECTAQLHLPVGSPEAAMQEPIFPAHPHLGPYISTQD